MRNQKLVPGTLYLIATSLAIQPGFGQVGQMGNEGPVHPVGVMGSMAGTPPPPVRITGKVALEDKSAPPSPVLIERLCEGLAHPEGTTDAKGSFALDLGRDIVVDPYSIHVQPGLDMAPAEAAHPFQDCLIRASLPGYRSDLVNMATSKPVGHPFLGTIVLHPVGKVDGYLISPTALAAPKDARKAFDRAQQLAHKNKPAEAIQSYQNAVGIDPGYAAGWYELGRLQAANHKIDDARRSFNSALEADPRYLSPYLQLAALASAEHDWPELAAVTTRLLALDALDFPDAYFYHALASFHTRKLEDAEKSARASIRIDVQHLFPDAYRLLASILVSRDQIAAACEQLETYLKLFPRADDAATVQEDLHRLKAALPSAKLDGGHLLYFVGAVRIN